MQTLWHLHETHSGSDFVPVEGAASFLSACQLAELATNSSILTSDGIEETTITFDSAIVQLGQMVASLKTSTRDLVRCKTSRDAKEEQSKAKEASAAEVKRKKG